MAIQGEVSKPEEIHRLFSEIEKQFGKVDVHVNNAGRYEFAPLESITREHMQKHFNPNVTGLPSDGQRGGEVTGPGWRVGREHRFGVVETAGLRASPPYTRVNFESSMRKRQLSAGSPRRKTSPWPLPSS